MTAFLIHYHPPWYWVFLSNNFCVFFVSHIGATCSILCRKGGQFALHFAMRYRLVRTLLKLHLVHICFHVCCISTKDDFPISQGSVATCLRWDGYCCMVFVANYIRFPAVQKFWKSVKILQSYKEFKRGNFFEIQFMSIIKLTAFCNLLVNLVYVCFIVKLQILIILRKIRKFCMKYGHLILRKIIKFVSTRCQILRLKYTKINFGWGSAADPAGDLTALPKPWAGFKGAYV